MDICLVICIALLLLIFIGFAILIYLSSTDPKLDEHYTNMTDIEALVYKRKGQKEAFKAITKLALFGIVLLGVIFIISFALSYLIGLAIGIILFISWLLLILF